MLFAQEPPTNMGPIPYIFGITVAALMTVIYYLYQLVKDAYRILEESEKRQREERREDQDRFEKERPQKWAEAHARAYTRKLDERDERRRGGA